MIALSTVFRKYFIENFIGKYR